MNDVAESVHYYMQAEGKTRQEAVQLARELLARQRENAKKSAPKDPIAVGARARRR